MSLDELEAGHVRPSMSFHLRRGVWFPLGYDQGALVDALISWWRSGEG